MLQSNFCYGRVKEIDTLFYCRLGMYDAHNNLPNGSCRYRYLCHHIITMIFMIANSYIIIIMVTTNHTSTYWVTSCCSHIQVSSAQAIINHVLCAGARSVL